MKKIWITMALVANLTNAHATEARKDEQLKHLKWRSSRNLSSDMRSEVMGQIRSQSDEILQEMEALLNNRNADNFSDNVQGLYCEAYHLRRTQYKIRTNKTRSKKLGLSRADKKELKDIHLNPLNIVLKKLKQETNVNTRGSYLASNKCKNSFVTLEMIEGKKEEPAPTPVPEVKPDPVPVPAVETATKEEFQTLQETVEKQKLLIEELSKNADAGSKEQKRILDELNELKEQTNLRFHNVETHLEIALEGGDKTEAELDAVKKEVSELNEKISAHRVDLSDLSKKIKEVDSLTLEIESEIKTALEGLISDVKKLEELKSSGKITEESYKVTLIQIQSNITELLLALKDKKVTDASGLVEKLEELNKELSAAIEKSESTESDDKNDGGMCTPDNQESAEPTTGNSEDVAKTAEEIAKKVEEDAKETAEKKEGDDSDSSEDKRSDEEEKTETQDDSDKESARNKQLKEEKEELMRAMMYHRLGILPFEATMKRYELGMMENSFEGNFMQRMGQVALSQGLMGPFSPGQGNGQMYNRGQYNQPMYQSFFGPQGPSYFSYNNNSQNFNRGPQAYNSFNSWSHQAPQGQNAPYQMRRIQAPGIPAFDFGMSPIKLSL